MNNQETFLRLLEELEPLKKSLAGNYDYQRIRMSFDDIVGFLDDKLLHVFLKYERVKPYEDMKALAITSLINVISRLHRKYGREVSLGEIEIPSPVDDLDMTKQIDHLMESLGKILDPEDAKIAKMIISPPLYVLDKVKDPGKRIPSHLFLDFLDIPITKSEIKHFNSCRRRLNSLIRERIDPITFSLHP